MKILAIAGDNQGCGYYRIHQPLGRLKQLGHEVTFSGTQDARQFDVVVGQRVSNEGAHREWLRLAGHTNRQYKLVFEVDDDLGFLPNRQAIEKANAPAYEYYTKDPARLERLRECARVADLITTTTETLARVLRKAAPGVPVHVLPNVIDQAMFSVEREPTDRYTVGFGGSRSHAGDWDEARDAVDKYLRRHQEALLHLVGVPEFASLFGGSVQSQIMVTPWQPIPEYWSKLRMDVGLGPLKPSPFNSCKSAIRVLEAQALGIVPCVSNTGPYRDAVRHGKDGYLCDNPADWYRALVELENPDRRRHMAKLGKERAMEQTVQKQAHKWLEAYESVM